MNAVSLRAEVHEQIGIDQRRLITPVNFAILATGALGNLRILFVEPLLYRLRALFVGFFDRL